MFVRGFRHLPPDPDGDQPGDPAPASSDETPDEAEVTNRAENGPAAAPGENGYRALLGGLDVDLLGGSDSDEDA